MLKGGGSNHFLFSENPVSSNSCPKANVAGTLVVRDFGK